MTGQITDVACEPAAGQFFCRGRCFAVACAVVDLLEGSGPPRLLLTTAAKAAAGSSTSLSLPYGAPVAFGLLPCTNSGVQHNLAVNTICLSVQYLQSRMNYSNDQLGTNGS